MNQSEIEANTSNKLKRGKMRASGRASKSQWVLVLLLIGWESGANFFNQSESEVKQNQSKHNITSNTHLKTAPLGNLCLCDCLE